MQSILALLDPPLTLKVADMHRITNIFQNSPNMLGKPQNHRWTTTIQRTMYPRPIVQVLPQQQRPQQHTIQPRNIASTPGQARLLASQSPVEPLQMRSVYLAANAQLPDTTADVFDPSKQSSGGNLQEVASGIPQLFDHSRKQFVYRLRYSFRLTFYVNRNRNEPRNRNPMTIRLKDMQDSCRIRKMLVHKQQERIGLAAADGHRCQKFLGRVQSAWANTQLYDKAADHSQSHKKVLIGCGCATRHGYVLRKTFDETSSAADKRKT